MVYLLSIVVCLARPGVVVVGCCDADSKVSVSKVEEEEPVNTYGRTRYDDDGACRSNAGR
jgi:hypothetical protein